MPCSFFFSSRGDLQPNAHPNLEGFAAPPPNNSVLTLLGMKEKKHTKENSVLDSPGFELQYFLTKRTLFSERQIPSGRIIMNVA
jgi:hypothetical protein